MGKHRLLLPDVQYAQGQPHAARGSDASVDPSEKAALQPAPNAQTRQPEIRMLARLPAVDRPFDYYEITIKTGKGRMPSFRSTLTDAQVTRVIEYMISIQNAG